jgi:hypothetical protein
MSSTKNNEADTLNLDLYAAETAQDIIGAIKGREPQTAENLITKALGVLQENGVYACALFLYAARSADQETADKVRNKLLQMSEKLVLPSDNTKERKEARDWKEGLRFVSSHICSDLDKLLLVRQVWEQTLIYARYGAKAWGVNPAAKRKSGEKP